MRVIPDVFSIACHHFDYFFASEHSRFLSGDEDQTGLLLGVLVDQVDQLEVQVAIEEKRVGLAIIPEHHFLELHGPVLLPEDLEPGRRHQQPTRDQFDIPECGRHSNKADSRNLLIFKFFHLPYGFYPSDQ